MEQGFELNCIFYVLKCTFCLFFFRLIFRLAYRIQYTCMEVKKDKSL